MRAGIVAVGSYLPKRVLTNKELERMVDTSDEWIATRTGIRERRIIDDNETTSDLATRAAKDALAKGSIRPEDIDLILLATITPDMRFPSTACFVQHKLGLKDIPCMDIGAACTGFVYALDMAKKYVESDDYQCVLVIGAEAISRMTDWTDRSTCVLFGDGAGAVIVKKVSGDRGILRSILQADGAYTGLLNMPGGGSLHPASHETVDAGLHYLKMKGSDIFKLAVRSMESVCRNLVERSGYSLNDVSLVIPHQANRRIIRAIADKLGVPLERFYINLETRGNMSAASAMVALDEAIQDGSVREGMLVLFVAFGGGLTWGANLVRW